MAGVQVATTTGAAANVDDAKIQALSSSLEGSVLRPGDADYDEARSIWNAMIDRKPALIARCASADDVVASVKFAKEHGLLVAIKGGGHNIAGNAVCEGGLLIDLSQMRGVTVDASAKRAQVEPGALLADVDAATQAHGLAVPLGINSTTGVAGLTLGGGFGWLSRKFGMTVDNLISADVVTADGAVVHVSESENADLFWAIRGGGGNFGVATRFEFQLHPLGPDVLSGLIVYPLEQGKQVLQKYAQFTQSAPDELSVWMVTRQAPPLPFLPEDVHGQGVVVLALCYAGDPKEGERLIEPLRSFGTPYGEHIGVQPYAAWQQGFDPLLGAGARNYWKSHNFDTISDGLIDAIIEYVGKLPSPMCEIFLGGIGGATERVSPDAMAYSLRDARYVMNVHGRWESPSDDDACIAWSREFFKKTEPFATGGVYVNFMTEEEGGRVGSAYGTNFDRLAQVKAKYDPSNLFRMNQNIAPKA